MKSSLILLTICLMAFTICKKNHVNERRLADTPAKTDDGKKPAEIPVTPAPAPVTPVPATPTKAPEDDGKTSNWCGVEQAYGKSQTVYMKAGVKPDPKWCVVANKPTRRLSSNERALAYLTRCWTVGMKLYSDANVSCPRWNHNRRPWMCVYNDSGAPCAAPTGGRRLAADATPVTPAPVTPAPAPVTPVPATPTKAPEDDGKTSNWCGVEQANGKSQTVYMKAGVKPDPKWCVVANKPTRRLSSNERALAYLTRCWTVGMKLHSDANISCPRWNHNRRPWMCVYNDSGAPCAAPTGGR